jgi:dipeptidyl aminopeptidase/acylaminoacyl peptidase
LVDPERIGVIDRSRGGLMVANLLTHNDLLRASTAQIVLLPSEDHGDRARESFEHALSEQLWWFGMYVKGAGFRLTAARGI